MADEEVVTEVVEPVGVEGVRVRGDGESGFGGEHAVAQPLGGDAVFAIGRDDQRVSGRGYNRIGGLTRCAEN
nr:hypothetical protein GCM10017611_38160 [Rhodococcus wratislaviensis]